MNERTKSIHSLVFLLQKNNCCEALLPVFLPGWRFYYVKKKKKGKCMDFEQFKEELASSVKEIMYSKYGMEVEVEARTMEKMNSSYEALTVKPEDSIIGVNLNATALYQQYEKGIDIDVITSKAAELAESALNSRPDFDIDSFKDYSKMKETLTMEVVSAERNAALLETVPHRIMEDMAVVYRFEVNTTTTERGSILVTNQMLDQYGITAEQLHADALIHAPEVKPIVIEGMAQVLAKQMGVEDLEMLGLNIPPEQEQIFVASVEGNVHGAGVIAYQDFMEKASERVGGESFFILPSSIHEILIVPDNGLMDLQHLESMVREVNATTVDPADKLTDNVYHYDAKDKVFELGEKFVERQNSKESKGIEAGEKKSLSAEIKAKKEQIANAPKKEAPALEPKAKEGKVK